MVFKFLLLSAQFIILLMIFVTSSEKQDDILQRNVQSTRSFKWIFLLKLIHFIIYYCFPKSLIWNLISYKNRSFREKTIWLLFSRISYYMSKVVYCIIIIVCQFLSLHVSSQIIETYDKAQSDKFLRQIRLSLHWRIRFDIMKQWLIYICFFILIPVKYKQFKSSKCNNNSSSLDYVELNVRTNGSLIDAHDKQTHMRKNTSMATDNL